MDVRPAPFSFGIFGNLYVQHTDILNDPVNASPDFYGRMGKDAWNIGVHGCLAFLSNAVFVACVTDECHEPFESVSVQYVACMDGSFFAGDGYSGD